MLVNGVRLLFLEAEVEEFSKADELCALKTEEAALS